MASAPASQSRSPFSRASRRRRTLPTLISGLVLSLGISACGEQITQPTEALQEVDPTSLQQVEDAPRAEMVPSYTVSGQSTVDVLVFGDYASARTTLAGALAAMGKNVTAAATLPADLSSYEVIWQTSAFASLTAAERTRLQSFLSDGGGLHINGERPCCEALNASVQQFVNSAVVGGGIGVGGRGDISGPMVMNTSAVGEVSTSPNLIQTYRPLATGGLSGVSGANVLVAGAGGVPVGAVWDGSSLTGGAGRLTLLMDVNWYDGGITYGDNRKLIENIQAFLESGVAADASPPVIVATVTGTTGDDGWYTSDASVAWSVTDAESEITATSGCDAASVTSDTGGVTFTCSATSTGGTATESVTIKRDATVPVVTYSGNAGTYTVDQTVAITCAASDATSGIASHTCEDVSGAAYAFDLGANTRSASATDNAGNVDTASTTFTVEVTFASLCSLTRRFVSQAGIANAMCQKLNVAAASASRGNERAKAGQLQAYVNHVQAQSGKSISAANAATLTRLAGAL